MAVAIKVFVVVASVLAVLSGWDLRKHSLRYGLLNDGVAVIAFVGNKVFSTQSFDEAASLCAIRNGTCSSNHSDRHTMRIHGQMYLGVEPPFVRPKP